MFRRDKLRSYDEVRAACQNFRQGDVVRDLTVSYTTSAGFPIISEEYIRQSADLPTTGVLMLPLAIITSQTCDIRHARRMAIRPLIAVARVLKADEEFDAGSVGHIRRGRYGDIILLTGPDFERNNETWVADLRLEATVERGNLVGRVPIRGFRDEIGYLDFQHRLGEARSRSAIDDRVLDSVLRPLAEFLENGGIDTSLIDEVRIRILPSMLEARNVELYFLLADQADPADVQEEITEWYVQLVPGLPHDLQLTDATAVHTSVFTRADEIGTERVDLDYLTPGE